MAGDVETSRRGQDLLVHRHSHLAWRLASQATAGANRQVSATPAVIRCADIYLLLWAVIYSGHVRCSRHVHSASVHATPEFKVAKSIATKMSC